jgi:hypothetical protein
MRLSVGIKTDDVVRFLRLQGYQLIGEGITILDVPPTTWVKGDTEISFYTGWDLVDLDDLSRWWGVQADGVALFNQLVEWAEVEQVTIPKK